MPAPNQPNLTPERDDQVPMSHIVTFVRQLGHDLRNHLNAAELQAAYIGELAEDPELKAEIKRLRGMISGMSVALQQITSALVTNTPTLMLYSAEDFVADVHTKITAEFPNDLAKLEWKTDVGAGTLQIDPQSLQSALTELLKNAFHHDRNDGVISVTARTDGGRFVFVIREPKSNLQLSTEKWGLEPFRSIGQGHYGLGLYRSRAIIESHGGQLSADYDPSSAILVTTVNLPLNKS